MARLASVVWFIVAGAGLSLRADPPPAGDLALQARAILRKYCADCHDTHPRRIGELSVRTRAGLERAGRPFLVPSSPSTSQIVHLIEDGSMPPGQRPQPSPDERRILRDWIAVGAPAYPATFDELYVRRAILADIEKRPAEQRPTGRYLSLHNLVRDDDPTFTLEERRTALRRAISQLSKATGDVLEPIDGAATIFRLELAPTGWDLRPFQRREVVDQKERLTPSSVNLYDLILIEYPFGRLDPSEPTFARLIETFLRPAGQLVPILYLRGDWLTDVFLGTRASADITRALELPQPSIRNGSPTPLPDDPLTTGARILPLDGIDASDHDSGEGGFGVLFDVWNAETRATARRFQGGNYLLFFLRPTRDTFVQLVWRNADGTCSVPNLGAHSFLGANTETILAGASGKGYRLKQNLTGRERLIVYAAESSLPPTEHLKTKMLDERVVHRFYPLPGEKPMGEVNPDRVIRKSVEIEITQPR